MYSLLNCGCVADAVLQTCGQMVQASWVSIVAALSYLLLHTQDEQTIQVSYFVAPCILMRTLVCADGISQYDI